MAASHEQLSRRTGRKQALQSGPMRPALGAGDFLECSFAFKQWPHLGHERF
jgi:hypothetical protein